MEPFTYLDDAYLLPIDGTGYFSSKKVHCKNCCIRNELRCQLRIVEALPAPKELKKNTYYLVEGRMYCAWQLHYVDKSDELTEIELHSVPGLEKVLYYFDIDKARTHRRGKVLAVLKPFHYERFGSNVTYQHNMLCGAIVHPDMKTVIPFAPEPILKNDGEDKNDCEFNAIKRYLSDFRKEHPTLKIIVVQDAIASTYPNLSLIESKNMSYIVGVKSGKNKTVFKEADAASCTELNHTTSDGTEHRYRYVNSVSLTRNNADFKVNFIEYWSEDKKGKTLHFSWVTNIEITDDNCYHIMRGGRSNWRIENNTFNTLKNQGYEFGHNFGHGKNHLCSVFGMLMLLAFFIDQIQQQACSLWKAARARYTSRSGLFDKVRYIFATHLIDSWSDLYSAIAYGFTATKLVPDTS